MVYTYKIILARFVFSLPEKGIYLFLLKNELFWSVFNYCPSFAFLLFRLWVDDFGKIIQIIVPIGGENE